MSADPRVSFFPGSSGAGEFWAPVARRLPAGWTRTLWSWRGAGDQPATPRVSSYADLIEFVVAQTQNHSDIVAQSMGGVVAIGLALRHPEKIHRLVLVATSGGLTMERHEVEDWRAEYRATFPDAERWVSDDRPDFTADIPRVRMPTLLIWGGQDSISPQGVGEHLHQLLPNSRLRIVADGTHSLAHDRPEEISAMVIEHLGRPTR